MKKIDILKKYLRIVMLLLLIIIGIYVVLVILPNKSKNNDDIEEVSKIKYDYVLYKRDSSIYKGIFNELKKELESDNINYDKYAEYVSELFIVDLYKIAHKILVFIKNKISTIVDDDDFCRDIIVFLKTKYLLL